MLNRSASLAMSTSVLKTLPGKLDIKRHSPSILYLQKPASLDSVTIDRPVLLDESPPQLTKIYIADTGKLVVSPDDGPLLLKLRHILIHGELHIGSEDCPFTEKFRIVLTGKAYLNTYGATYW